MRGLFVKDLRKIYNKKRVVDQVSLDVESGEVVGLLGPNGAGKTTTFYMMVGFIKPEAGQIFLHEDDITENPMYQRARKGIGYLPQESSVFRKMTVAENVLAILETLPISRPERRIRLAELLSELKIDHLAGQKAYALSGGERRRLEITRALVISPSFMLLDEPFAGVDPLSVTEIQHIIGHLRSKGIGVLISDHNVRETLGVCDRAYILNEGRIIESGTPDVIAQSSIVRKTYLGEEFRL
ncbi:MAG: LPS export ABC transporter ATP-binding protein [Desulfobacterales bacterium C00003106]|jgi:lipopolysaccharide export system ATP-binding protein|nr:MAG: LPS export ABC transporter ATP-binding protein [Desulfobacterales bacterium C00003106]